LRTARNKNFITAAEQKRYRNLKIGIMGMSVGSNVIWPLVASGGPKFLRIADADTIEISNLNRMLAPILENVGKDFGDRMEFLKINLDAIPMTAQKLGIDKIPTVIVFKNGEVATGFVGLRPEVAIREWLEDFLKVV